MGLLRSDEGRASKARLDQERRRRDENPVRRFEYQVLRVGAKARAEGQLNELGAKGWQLVQVVEGEGHFAFYLEREIAEEDAAVLPEGEAEAERAAEPANGSEND
jgi:hypothetical protein